MSPPHAVQLASRRRRCRSCQAHYPRRSPTSLSGTAEITSSMLANTPDIAIVNAVSRLQNSGSPCWPIRLVSRKQAWRLPRDICSSPSPRRSITPGRRLSIRHASCGKLDCLVGLNSLLLIKHDRPSGHGPTRDPALACCLGTVDTAKWSRTHPANSSTNASFKGPRTAVLSAISCSSLD